MSINLEGKKCVVCQSYLFPEDDVVFCPICGAPHHRDCYAEIGRCGLQELHGTDFEYGRREQADASGKEQDAAAAEETASVRQIECLSCHTKYSADQVKCPFCGMPNMAGRRFMMFDLLGGVPKMTDLGEGVSAERAAQLVMLSTTRYIPHFKAFKDGKRSWFNAWAFFFPSAWMGGRKMYWQAFLSALCELAGLLLFTPMTAFMSNHGVETYEQAATFFSENLATQPALYALMAGGCVFLLLLRFVCGFFAETWYYRHVLKTCRTIEEIGEDDDDRRQLYRSKGGFNVFSFLAFVLAMEWLPSLLASLLL